MKNANRSYFTDQNQVEYWDRVYDQQDFRGERYQERMHVTLSWLDGLGLPHNSMILDVGCGTGRVAVEAAQRGYPVVGLDYSREMLESAKGITRRGSDLILRFLQGDIEFLPIRDSSFDVVICLGVISYLPALGGAMREMARILKPDGVLVVSFINKARAIRYFDLPQLVVRKLQRLPHVIELRKISADSGTQVRRQPYLIPKIQKSLEQSGFTLLECRTISYEQLTFLGRQIYPQRMARAITRFFDEHSKIPLVGSLGGLCLIKARKAPLVHPEIPDLD